MTLEIREVVCDWGVYVDGKLYPGLIFNSKANAEEVLRIICLDFDHKRFDYVELNKNQQIVLKWLKEKYSITDIEPIELFWRLHVNTKNKFKMLPAYRTYKTLTREAQLEVLQVFSQWALEQEAE
jgi:hypothetical protein